MSAEPNLLSVEPSGDVDAVERTNPVATMAQWIARLASDVEAVLAASERLAKGAPLRAPLRAGLRHLLHIHPLSTGIEALAMLEVAFVLRVTALLARPAEELDDETVLRLRAETSLIEELFPAERGALWSLCERLIEKERELEPPISDLESLADLEEGVVELEAMVDEAVAGERVEVSDVLSERAREWSRGYVAPAFGTHAQELTRVTAFVKHRALAWAG